MGKQKHYQKPKVRSDIPYSERVLMNKRMTIAAHRNEAARIALQMGCVALNDTEGLGYTRLTRFAKHLAELIDEYYADPELGQAHLERRLRLMGFTVQDGHMYCIENTQTGEVVKPEKILDIAAQAEEGQADG